MTNAFSVKEIQDFGAVLRRRRKELGLTMVDVSNAVGIGRNHYGRIEAGVLSPRTAFLTIFKILTCLKFYWVIEIRPMPDDKSIQVFQLEEKE